MEIAGRITNNATVHELKDGRQVVNFSIAVNDSYKRKGEEQFTEMATFFNCSYWRNPGIAKHLTKGRVVHLYGRVSVNAYVNAAGEPMGSLQFHVNEIKFLSSNPKAVQQQNTVAVSVAETVLDEKDDLPF